MRIGVLGTGDVGRVLGAAFAKRGHTVKIGSRDPAQEKVRAWVAKTGSSASAGTFAEAAAFGEVVVLATPWTATESIVEQAGPKSFSGKLVLDATNPLDFSGGVPPKLAVSGADSAGERIQRWLPDAKVVKAFNTVGNQHMDAPDFPGGPPDMFVCGDDAAAKKTAGELIRSLGFGIVDSGPISSSRYLEALAMVWILEFFATGSGDHALKFLRK